MNRNLRKLNVTVMRQTAESIHLLAKEAGLSEGEVVDRLTLKFTPTDADLAANILMEEMAMILAKLPRKEHKEVFTLIASMMLALLPPPDWQTLLDGANEIRTESFRTYEAATEEEKAEMRKSLEANLQKKLIHPKLSPEEWANIIWKGEGHHERTVDGDDSNGNE